MKAFNSTLNASTKPMKRSPMKRGTKPMKTRGPKMTPIRKSAKGEECTVRLPWVCNYNPETTVLAHSNALADGKGMGLKAPDTQAAYCCSACHDVVDGRAPRPAALNYELMMACFTEGIAQTQRILKRKGLMKEAA
jgi:hypothetical protein